MWGVIPNPVERVADGYRLLGGRLACPVCRTPLPAANQETVTPRAIIRRSQIQKRVRGLCARLFTKLSNEFGENKDLVHAAAALTKPTLLLGQMTIAF